MKNKTVKTIGIFLFFFLLTVILFWKFFFKGLIPFPGDFMLAWYEPWHTYYTSGTTITIVNKAVADDVFRQFFPYKELIAHAFLYGQLPLWNPYNGSGMPLLATMHVGVLNPFNVVFILFPAFFSWGLYVVIQPLFVGFFTYLYATKLKLSPIAALFTGIIFTLSGFVIIRLVFGEFDYVVACLPLLLYLLECFFGNPRTKRIFILPFTVFFICISGHPQAIFYVLLFSLAYAIFFGEKLEKKHKLFLLFLFIAGIGLASIQLFPTAELFLQANVSPASSRFIFEKFLLPPQHFLTILFPNFFGNQATYNYFGYADYIETIAYIGLLPVFFALYSLFGKKGSKVKSFYFGVVIITILLTLNWIGSQLFYRLPIPIVATGIPTRIFVLTTFSIAILAGYGFDEWVRTTIITKRTVIFSAIYTAFNVFIWVATFLLYRFHVSCGVHAIIIECRQVTFRNTTLEIIPFFLCLSLFFLYLRGKQIGSYLMPYGIILLVLCLGVYNANKFLPFSSRNTFYPTNPLLTFLQGKTGYDRVFGFNSADIKTDFATHFRYFDPQYYDPLYNKRYGELVAYANTGEIPTVLPRSDVGITDFATVSAGLALRRTRLFDLLSVKYLISKKSEVGTLPTAIWSDGIWQLTENVSSLPRAYFVTDILSNQSPPGTLRTLFSKSFNPKTTAVLEGTNIPIIKHENTLNASTDISSYSENSVTIRTRTNNPAVLVLTDNYYPGWKAIIDSRQTPIYRTNYTLRGIFVPKGDHLVTFMYAPESSIYGILISLASTLFTVVLFMTRKRFLE